MGCHKELTNKFQETEKNWDFEYTGLLWKRLSDKNGLKYNRS